MEKRKAVSKKAQLHNFKRDGWLCCWCKRPIIFAPALRLLHREVRASGFTGPLAYYHAHATRAGAPLLDELWAVLDHAHAHSMGGLNDKDNLVTACNKCNGRKNNAPLDELGETSEAEAHEGQGRGAPTLGRVIDPVRDARAT